MEKRLNKKEIIIFYLFLLVGVYFCTLRTEQLETVANENSVVINVK